MLDPISINNGKVSLLSDKKREHVSAFINMSDGNARLIAKSHAYKDYDKKNKNLTETGLAVIAADTLVSAAAKKGQLSDKLGKGLRTGKDWGIMLGVCYVYNKLTNAITKKSPALQKFNEDHPTTSAVANLAGFVGLTELAFRATNKVKFIVENSDDLKNSINNSKINKVLTKKVQPAVAEFTQKAAQKGINLKGFGQIASRLFIPIAGIGILAKIAVDALETKKNENIYYNSIKTTQLNAAKEYAAINELESQLNGVLAEHADKHDSITNEGNCTKEEPQLNVEMQIAENDDIDANEDKIIESDDFKNAETETVADNGLDSKELDTEEDE